MLETEDKFEGIRELPYSCCLVSDPYLKKLGIRFMPVNNYVAFLRINGAKNEVEVVRFLYGKREWKEILKGEEES